ncbi:MAG: hypothetical protein NTX75_13825 [Proteobacteria bacterium]|nr:hypothetical protein [Pseudomonadota bacterium]
MVVGVTFPHPIHNIPFIGKLCLDKREYLFGLIHGRMSIEHRAKRGREKGERTS